MRDGRTGSDRLPKALANWARQECSYVLCPRGHWVELYFGEPVAALPLKIGRGGGDWAEAQARDERAIGRGRQGNEGRAAITRPITVSSATATLAPRLAMLPATSSAHGSRRPGWPARDSASSVVDAATIIPSTESGVSMAIHPGCPHCAGDQGQERHTCSSRPPDPRVRPPGHRWPSSTNSPVMAGMYVTGDSLRRYQPPCGPLPRMPAWRGWASPRVGHRRALLGALTAAGRSRGPDRSAISDRLRPAVRLFIRDGRHRNPGARTAVPPFPIA